MEPGRTLDHAEARRFYDRLGARQDTQAFYEAPAVERLLEHLELGRARAVVELGCGTGRLAERLLAGPLSGEARYLGLDLSATMVELARRRVAAYTGRAEVRQTTGPPTLDAPDGAFDRFLSTYVLDLLSDADIALALDEAHRVLRPGGLLGLVSLCPGQTPASRALIWLWVRVHRLRPAWVGGCRPLELAPRLDPGRWGLRHRSAVVAWGVPSEVIVAERLEEGAPKATCLV